MILIFCREILFWWSLGFSMGIFTPSSRGKRFSKVYTMVKAVKAVKAVNSVRVAFLLMSASIKASFFNL
jgi:hypothetical protein